MRKPQPEQFRLPSGQHYIEYYIEVDPAGTAVTDLFRPEFWVNAGDLIKPLAHIRVRATDNSYDFRLTVIGKPENGKGLIVDLWPRYPAGMSREELQAAGDMVRTVLRASTVNSKPVPRVEPHGRDGWRVIGIAGEIVSSGHRGEADANIAMAKHLSQLGIKTVIEPVAEVKPEGKAKAAAKAA